MRAPGIVATVVGAAGVAVFTALLIAEKIGTAGYVSLLSLLVLTCLVIPVLERLKTLDVKNLKVTLEKIESVKKEIYAKESDLRKTSLLLAELIAANTTVTGIWGNSDTKKYSDALVRTKIMHLAKQLGLTPNELAEIFKYEKALSEVHAAPKEEHDRRWGEFVQLLKRESESSS
ncbi:hypothetical protein [Ramlibacter sp. WS9]|uniref:hypothetical protein n=1 Tax=Ramlibacter sp. WS9 TaxID=1882741 RepID=UPI0011437D9C|nr:hypothetical protein [Ramlibacter sp. WS9]ROZ61384.1 hypothetical protein EEB15_33025 [Ramlibacter sp. WS9]